MDAKINPYIVFFDRFCEFIDLMMGSECMWGLGEGSNFQLVRDPQNYVLGHIQTEGAI